MEFSTVYDDEALKNDFEENFCIDGKFDFCTVVRFANAWGMNMDKAFSIANNECNG